MGKLGIDISEHNTIKNYGDVVKSADFAILRVGYGVTYMPVSQKDSKFEDFYANLHGKVPVGAYYYAYANAIGEGKKEAENCLKYLNGKKLDMPIFYDLEDNSMRYINEVAREFVDTIKAAGYDAGIYCNTNWARNKIDTTKFNDCTIWLAQYGANNGKVPSDKPKFKYDIWQYTSKGELSGINGYVDLNISNVNYEEKAEPKDDKQEETKPSTSGNNEIKNIQTWLNNNYNTGLVVDGIYGSKTKAALIKAYQTELNKQFNRNLVVDGIYGKNTSNAYILLKKGAEGNITKIIQAMLYCKGYDTNGVDGIFAGGTEKAVKKFQKANGLTVDGIVGKNTLNKLFS